VYRNDLNKVILKTNNYNFNTKNKKEGIPKGSNFETVKPYEFLTDLILNFPNKNIKILDFFAGSGTTAVSTNLANEKDQGNRKWTIIEKSKKTVNNVLLPKFKYFKIKKYIFKEK